MATFWGNKTRRLDAYPNAARLGTVFLGHLDELAPELIQKDKIHSANRQIKAVSPVLFKSICRL